MKAINEINELFKEAVRFDNEEFDCEQEESEIHLQSERIAAEEFASYEIENDLSYSDVSKGW